MLTRRSALLAEIETTYGVDPTPSPSADAVECIDLEIKVNGEVIERDVYRSTFSKATPGIALKHGEITFKLEMKGSGTAGTVPVIGKFLKACGMGETIVALTSVTYAPLSDESNIKSLTIYAYKDGLVHKLNGCQGTWVFDGEAGKYGIVTFTFTGLFNSIVAASLPALSNLETTLPQKLVSASLTWGAYSAIASKINIDYGSKVTIRESVSALTGIARIRISDRSPIGSFNPDAVVEATHPFWGDWEAGTLRALAFIIGATAGNIVTITAPKCFSTGPGYEDDSGVVKYNIPFQLIANDSSGDNELSIAFT